MSEKGKGHTKSERNDNASTFGRGGEAKLYGLYILAE